MPELPEVEITLRGIKPHILGLVVRKVLIRQARLRWPVPATLSTGLNGHTIQSVSRRGKYLLLGTSNGTLILHLGMSGNLRLLLKPTLAQKHDHIDVQFTNNICLRLNDPRRFGACLWTKEDPFLHPLLAHLGPEPFSPEFHADYLWKRSRGRKVPIKNFIMDSQTVVGVGNIYAAESLFIAGLHPKKSAGKISLKRYSLLVEAIKTILAASIRQGGSSLKDFLNSEGKKGYFTLHLRVYGRGGLPCLSCKTPLKEIRLGQRSSVYCPSCQN